MTYRVVYKNAFNQKCQNDSRSVKHFCNCWTLSPQFMAVWLHLNHLTKESCFSLKQHVENYNKVAYVTSVISFVSFYSSCGILGLRICRITMCFMWRQVFGEMSFNHENWIFFFNLLYVRVIFTLLNLIYERLEERFCFKLLNLMMKRLNLVNMIVSLCSMQYFNLKYMNWKCK